MSRPLVLAALLAALAPAGLASAAEKTLELRPAASRAEIKTALAAAGHPTDDATVDLVAARLALARLGVPATPSPRGKTLELRAGASRDEVKAALAAAGHPTDDATVDRITAQVAAALPANAQSAKAPAAPSPQGKTLELRAGASRDEVKAALAAAGLPTDDATVDKITAQAAAALPASAATNQPTPPATPPRAKPVTLPETLTRPAEFHEFLNQNLACINLEYTPDLNQYFAAVTVNGKPGRFQIDSGAAHSVFALKALPRFGMSATSLGKLAGGIGGEQESYITRFDSIRLGPTLGIPGQQLIALDMGKTADSDGLIGADILTAANAIIDHRHHRFLHPYSNHKVDILAKAKEAGMESVTLLRDGTHSLLDATINGKPVRFLLDTGAQQSVLDSDAAARLGLASIESKLEVVGVGDTAKKMRLTTVDDIAIGGTHLRRAPLLVMPLGHVQGGAERKFDGILGAEFFYATEALFDVGNRRLFLEPRPVKLGDYTKTGGEMFDSDAELRAAHAASSWVGFARLASLTLMPHLTAKDPAGNNWIGVELTVIIEQTLKGTPLPVGSSHTFSVIVPDRPDLQVHLTGLFGRNPGKILFLNPEQTDPAAIRPYSERIWTDGELPRAQLTRVLHLALPPLPTGPATK